MNEKRVDTLQPLVESPLKGSSPALWASMGDSIILGGGTGAQGSVDTGGLGPQGVQTQGIGPQGSADTGDWGLREYGHRGDWGLKGTDSGGFGGLKGGLRGMGGARRWKHDPTISL